MKFTIAAANGTSSTYDGTYSITDAGVLSVKPEKANPVVFSPAGWFALEIKDAPPSRINEQVGLLSS